MDKVTTQINLFGELRITHQGAPISGVNTNRLQSLLAWLILHGVTPQSRERVASLLWPESEGSQARTNLRQLLHHLKRALQSAGSMLRIDNSTVGWQSKSDCAIDVVDFDILVSNTALSQAAQLYTDDLLPSLYDDWLAPIRDQYRHRMADVLFRLASSFESQGKFSDALPPAERLVALDPLSEPNYQLLMRLHAANRDRAGALRVYHQCMSTLRRELAVPPGPATVALFESILKGPKQALEANTPVLRALAEPDRTFVGRVSQWERLHAEWNAVAQGPARFLAISGEPGIGKTRLAEEVLRTACAAGHATARTRCYSGNGQVAYAPVAEWLRAHGIRASWPDLSAAQLVEVGRLVSEVREQYPDLEPARPFTESWQRLHFYESIRAAFVKATKPLLLFIDDLQWCDGDSLDWLQSLLLLPSVRSLLVVGTVRSEETGRDHPFTKFLAALSQAGVAAEIALAPLNVAETEQLARQSSSEPIQSEGLAELVRSTRGNPLFVVETVRAGLQSTRVHAVIASRLSALPAPAYELAGIASVVGRPFSFELMEKASDWDESSVSEAMDQLWRRHVIESRGPTEYDFTHDRLREVAYAELSLVRRRFLHRRVARALIELHANDLEDWHGQIASHYRQAGLPDEAMRHFRLAADFAKERFAHTEAADLLRQALAVCREFSESTRTLEIELGLLVALGPVLFTTEGYSAVEVGDTYDRAFTLSKRLKDRELFVALSGLWVVHIVRGDLTKSRDVSLQFLASAGTAPAPGLLMAGNFILGASYFHLGELERSHRHLRLAMTDHGDASDSLIALFAGPDLGVFCQSYLAHLAWHCSAFDGNPAPSELAHAALEVARRKHHPFSQAIAMAYAAMLEVFRGDSASALERGLIAVDLCERHGFVYYLAVANVLTGWAKSAQGEHAEGLGQIRSGVNGMRALGAEIRLPYYYALLADACRRAGKVPEGMASLSTGFAFLGKNQEDWSAPELYRVQGESLLSEGKVAHAATSFRQGLEAARRCGSQAFARRNQILLERTDAAPISERLRNGA